MGHEAGADIGAGAAAILNDDLLIKTLRHRLGHKPLTVAIRERADESCHSHQCAAKRSRARPSPFSGAAFVAPRSGDPHFD
jgi:hypothetical protein